jgi:hypothetical protein
MIVVEWLVWSAARRLAWLVLGALLIVSVPFVAQARIGLLSAATGGLAVALLASSLLPLLRAGRMLRHLHAPPKVGRAHEVYRANARAEDPDPEEREATHQSAVALLLLALSAALTIVTAASR